MARVIIQNGPEAGRSFEIPPTGLILGRAQGSNCDVPLGGASVSSRHARLYFDGSRGSWYVRDLGSVNGTRVDGRPVDLAEVRDGSVLCFAEIEVRFSMDDVGAAVDSSSSGGLGGHGSAGVGVVGTGQYGALRSNASFLRSISQGADIYLDHFEGAVAELRAALAKQDPAQAHLAVARVVDSGQLEKWLSELRGIREAEDNVLSNILDLLGSD